MFSREPRFKNKIWFLGIPVGGSVPKIIKFNAVILRNTSFAVSRIGRSPGSIEHLLVSIYFFSMRMIYYPDEKRIAESIENDDPLLLLVSFDGEQTIIGNIDDCLEHHILLKKAGFPETDLEKYFRIIVNKSGASWTYVCPGSYLNIKNREFRLKKYYENGIDEITKVLKSLKYEVPIDIPERYRRHFDALKDNGNSK